MLGDEAQQEVVKMTHKGAEITAKTLTEMIRAYLNSSQKLVNGEQTLKQLNRKGKALNTISVTNDDLKGIKKELKKFGVDYAILKSQQEADTVEVYFKGTDVDQINTALKNYTARNISERKEEEASLIQIIKAAIEKAKERNKQIEKAREKAKKQEKQSEKSLEERTEEKGEER